MHNCVFICVSVRVHYSSSLSSPCGVDIHAFEVFLSVDAGASAARCNSFVILIRDELWLRVWLVATNSTADYMKEQIISSV